MSPEQALAKPLDARSDIFSLGLVLWELLAGRPALRGQSDLLVLQALTTGRIEPPSTSRDGIPRLLESIIMRALARNPDLRFLTMSAFADELLEFQTSMGLFGEVHLDATVRRFVRAESVNSSTRTRTKTLPEELDSGAAGARFEQALEASRAPSESNSTAVREGVSEVIVRDDFTLTLERDCIVLHYRAAPTMEAAEGFNRFAEEACSNYAKFFFVTIIDDAAVGQVATPPVRHVSAAFAESLNKFGGHVAATLVLSRSTGLRGMAVRTAISAVNIASRRAYPSIVVTDASKALAWLGEHGLAADRKDWIHDYLQRILSEG
jgi:hypothetical protein